MDKESYDGSDRSDQRFSPAEGAPVQNQAKGLGCSSINNNQNPQELLTSYTHCKGVYQGPDRSRA